MKRREAIVALAAGGTAAFVPWTRAAASAADVSLSEWDALRRKVGARLVKVQSPLADCVSRGGDGAESLLAACKNPYYLSDEPGLTQTFGWVDAWTTQPSDYGVAARSADDVAATIDFARRHGIRLVVKGGGHSYLGNSNAAGSLLLWTKPMNRIDFHDAFRGEGWPEAAACTPAVSVGTGCLWGHVYQAASRRGRYVQGGGCLTVGVAGFTLGGGFGWFSKRFGTGASNLLEAELVTADGRVRVVNRYQDPDLFFALCGGGGGTFGVATRLTMRTFPALQQVGLVQFGVTAANDEAWRLLVERMLGFYAEALFNPRWGEQIRLRPRRRLSVSMLANDLTREEMEAVWRPFLTWLRSRPEQFVLTGEPMIMAFPGSAIFDPDQQRAFDIVATDNRPGASSDNVFWKDNIGEAAQVLYAYRSAWLPSSLLDAAQRGSLVDALVAASAEWPISLHTNKGLGGGGADAIERTRQTATNPAVLDAFALLICAADADPAWPGLKGHEPDMAEGRRQAAAVARAMRPIDRLVPDSGCYMSESDFFHPDYKRAYWGRHYPRLVSVKRRTDPRNMFSGRNCVELT